MSQIVFRRSVSVSSCFEQSVVAFVWVSEKRDWDHLPLGLRSCLTSGFRNAHPSYGDSPWSRRPEAGLRRAGLVAAAEAYAAQLATSVGGQEMSYPHCLINNLTRHWRMPHK
jgi:hypothetical protein